MTAPTCRCGRVDARTRWLLEFDVRRDPRRAEASRGALHARRVLRERRRSISVFHGCSRCLVSENVGEVQSESELPEVSTRSSCEHAEVDVWPGSAPDDEDYHTAPYGRILQRGICLECARQVERALGPSGWMPWLV